MAALLEKSSRFLSRISWMERSFLLLVLFLPLQKKFKIFHSFSKALCGSFSFPPGFQKNLYLFVSDLFLIALALFFLYRLGARLFAGASKYLTAFFGVALLSLIFSQSSVLPLQYFRLMHLFLFVTLFSLLSAKGLFKNREELVIKAFWIVFALSMFECAVGISQYFLQREMGLKYLGEGYLGGFPTTTGHLWIFDRLFNVVSEVKILKRACGTFLHPNVFGGFMMMAVLITYHLTTLIQERWKRGLFFMAIFFQTFTLFLSFSRAALIALLFATFLWLFLRRREKQVVKSVGSVFVLSSLLSLFLLLPALQDRGGVVNYNEVAQVSDQGRVIFHDIAFEMVKKHPWFGVGYNNYTLRMQEFSSVKLQPVQFFPVHNIYLLVAAEEGLIGLLLFLLFVGAVVVNALKGGISCSGISLLAIFSGFLFIGGCDFYLIGSQHGKLMFFLIAGLLNGERKDEFVSIN